MSTRSQIGFYMSEPNTDAKRNKFAALIYRHSDGMPERVLPDILPILNMFQTYRGINDLQYCSANLLYGLKVLHENWQKKYHAKMKRSYNSDNHQADYDACPDCLRYRLLNLGISDCLHVDIEYFYAVTPSALYVYSVTGGFTDKRKFELIETVSLEHKN